MINVEKKIIYLGYGDVDVASTWSMIMFIGIKSSNHIEPGTYMTNEFIRDNNIEGITQPINIQFSTLDDLMIFKKLVEKIDGDAHTSFEYEGYTFDFHNYNKGSIKAILYHIKSVERHLISLMAC